MMEMEDLTGSSSEGEDWDDILESESETWMSQSTSTFSFPDSYHESEEENYLIYFPRWALRLQDFCSFILFLLFITFLALDGNIFSTNNTELQDIWTQKDVFTLLVVAFLRVSACCLIYPLFWLGINCLRLCNGGYHLYHPVMENHFAAETWRDRICMCVFCGICLVASFFSAYVASVTTPVAVQTAIALAYLIPLYTISVVKFHESVTVIKLVLFAMFFTGVLIACFNENRDIDTVKEGDKVGGVFCAILSPLFFMIFLLNWRNANPRPRSQYTTHVSLSLMGFGTLVCLSPLLLFCYVAQPASSDTVNPDSSLLEVFGTSAIFSCLEIWMVGMMLSFSTPMGVAMSFFVGMLLEWLFNCQNGCGDGPMKIIGFILVTIATVVYFINLESLFPVLKKQQLYPDPRGPTVPVLPGSAERDGEEGGNLDLHDDEDFLMFRYQPMRNN